MSVYIKKAVWPTNIPYECTDVFALGWIKKFNEAVQHKIFVPRASETDYVEFSPSESQSNCEVGRSGGKQTLSYKPSDQRALLHEMCHCCALGHENFHPNWPYKDALLKKKGSIHAFAYTQNSTKYLPLGAFDAESIMLYGNAAFFTEGDTDKDKKIDLTPPKATTLSVLDVHSIALLYPNAEKV